MQPATSAPMDAVGLARDLAAGATRPGQSADYRLRAWLERSLADLNGLRMATRAQPDDTFFAAGVAVVPDLVRPGLALGGPDDAAGRHRRTRWARCGRWPAWPAPRVDADTAEEPGKIPHELRRGEPSPWATWPCPRCTTAPSTPPRCGSACCTTRGGPGLPTEEVAALLPHPGGARCAGWSRYADADGDGFLEYIDASGHGLANQGWKDSGRRGPVRRRLDRRGSGRAVRGAGLRVRGGDERGRPAGRVRPARTATAIATGPRSWPTGSGTAFWCGTGHDRFPRWPWTAHKQRVDSLTSNIGHLLGTGLLDAEEELAGGPAPVRAATWTPGCGLRTMSAADGGYSPAELPLRLGLAARHRHRDPRPAPRGARRVRRRSGRGPAAGLGGLRAATARAVVRRRAGPVPYPAACRPQAWSAAAAVVVAGVLATDALSRWKCKTPRA